MREMKQSGIEWIGEVPSSWKVRRLRYVGEFSASGIDKLIHPNEPLVRIINYTDVYNNTTFCLKDKDYMTVSAKYEKIKEHQVVVGDLLFTPSSETVDDIGISALVTKELPNTAFSYHIIRFKFKTNVVISFRKYICNNHFVYSYFSSSASGTIRQTLSREDFKNALVILPPIPEQVAIANYLDDKCGKIDALIEIEEKIIAELKEYKKSIIQQAIAKNCDHWETKRFCVVFELGKGLNITKEDLKDEGISVVNYGEIHSKYGRELNPDINKLKCVDNKYLENGEKNLLRYGDFVFADTSEDIDGSGNFTFLNSKTPIFAGYHTIIARPKIEVDYLFLSFFLDSYKYRSQIQENVFGVKVLSITKRVLKRTNVWLPPLFEQKAIAEYLDKKCAEVDQLIVIKQQKIAELKEYKKSLIYECVTGKREVR